ncbi:MAG: hypothetical protein H7Z19_20835 [Chitinophagaceae bacterium]|nr:hypothetical protein [Rubrivivax sp.]
MGELSEVKRQWLTELAALVGDSQAAEPPQKAGRAPLPGLAGGSATAQAAPGGGSAAPGGPFTPSPSGIVGNPYGPDSVFSIPTTPMVPTGPTTAAKVSANAPMDTATSAWTQAHSQMTTHLGQLKNAILSAFVGEAPALVADLQKKVTKLDVLTKLVDRSLADALTKVNAAGDAAGRKKAVQAVGAIVGKFRNHLKAQEKLLAQIDANPFGVKMNLKQELASSLDQVSKAIH